VSIVSSTFAVGPAQRDGRAYVTETHTDNIGIAHVVNYLAAVGTDYAAVMSARAPLIAVQIADAEFVDNLNRTSGFTLNYQTKAELASRFRAAYRGATRDVAASMAYWLIERINDGTVTDAQVQAAFGLTTTQYNAMKARATTLHDHWAAVLVAVGE
jgi:hypothetical protein